MVLAVLVSVGAWAFVVYNYEPMTQTTYSGVPVECTGEKALAERGLAVSEVESEDIGVTLSQRRIDSGRISNDNINVKADVSNCVAGDNIVTLNVTSPADTTVVSSDIDTININVGRAKSSVMGIDIIYTEDAEEGAEPVTFDLSQTEAEVMCTAATLKKVDRVAAVLKYSEVTDALRSYTVKLQALDRDGVPLQHVVMEPDEISLDATAGFTKTVSLTVPVKNDSDDNYNRKYTAPQTVTIKGAQKDIDKVGSVRAYEADISYVYEDSEIAIEYNLPENVYIADESEGQTLSVRVTKKEKKNDGEET